jgi:cytochrome P450
VSSVTDFDRLDFFRAKEIYKDPYPFYEYLRSHGPVWREPHNGAVMITGYEEAMSVYTDPERFSNCNSVSGPFANWPVPLEGDDISAIIEEYRDLLPFSDQLPTFDPPKHTAHRALLMRLITPKRLKENEEFMWGLADERIDGFIDRGACEFLSEFAGPFTLLVVADLLGVPEEDREAFRVELQGDERPTSNTGRMVHKPLEFLYDRFTTYIEDRRRNPQNDVMTKLATAPFPDGTMPEVKDIMLIASNLFAAGGETTARLLMTMMQFLAEDPDLQAAVRADRELIPHLIEESVRLESPLQGEFKLARVPVEVGGLELPAGTSVFVLNGAANRDPRQFDDPTALELDRPNWRQHLGFGFGIHTCAGAPLARAEARVTLEKVLDRMGDIRIDESVHGPAGAREYDYTQLYLLRGLESLHLKFTPING